MLLSGLGRSFLSGKYEGALRRNVNYPCAAAAWSLMLTDSRNMYVSRFKMTVPSVPITACYKDQNGCHSCWVCSQYPTLAEEEERLSMRMWYRGYFIKGIYCTDGIYSVYRGTDKSLARPTSRYICLMVRIFRLMLVLLYINSTNIPPIMIINRIYKNQNLSLVSFLVGLRTYQHPCILFDGENISFDASLVIYKQY